MSSRIRNNKLNITRYNKDIARYTMIKHGNDEGNKANADRFKILQKASHYRNKDGLNNLKYDLVGITLENLYTNVTVAIDKIKLDWNLNSKGKDTKVVATADLCNEKNTDYPGHDLSAVSSPSWSSCLSSCQKLANCSHWTWKKAAGECFLKTSCMEDSWPWKNCTDRKEKKGLVSGPRHCKSWRDDLKCGPSYPLVSGEASQCDPNSPEGFSCCNLSSGWCGKTKDHCKCSDCEQYIVESKT